MHVWIVEAVCSRGKTLWRKLFDSANDAAACWRVAGGKPKGVHFWEM